MPNEFRGFWGGLIIGLVLTLLACQFIKVPRVYARAVKDCMNGRAQVTISADTIVVAPDY